MNTRELREKRAGLVRESRAVLGRAEDGKLTAEDETQYNAIMDKVLDMGKAIEREETQAELEREMAASQGHIAGQEGETRDVYEFESRGMQGQTTDSLSEEWKRRLNTMTPEYQADFIRWLASGEKRALQVDSDTAGGYLQTPIQFVDRLIKAVDNAVFMRQWATVFSVPNAGSLGAPSLDNDPADPIWTSELNIGDEDSTMSVGKRELSPHPLAKYIKVSNTLLRKVPSVEALVRNRLAYKFAVTAENAYQNGTGANQPLGVFVASDDGISTSRDQYSGAATSFTFDGLISCKYTLKQPYWPRAKWIFHRNSVKKIAKLKSSDEYLWRESVRVGEPDRILGIPVFMSEYTPSTFTENLYIGMVGDFSYYWIADALDMSMQRLAELFAATNQTGFVGRLESDGMPVLEEAFVRVKLTATEI